MKRRQERFRVCVYSDWAGLRPTRRGHGGPACFATEGRKSSDVLADLLGQSQKPYSQSRGGGYPRRAPFYAGAVVNIVDRKTGKSRWWRVNKVPTPHSPSGSVSQILPQGQLRGGSK